MKDAIRFLLSMPVLALCLAPAIAAQQTVPTTKLPGGLQRADAAFRAGYAAMQAGHLDEARSNFALAAKLAPQIPEAHIALAEVLVNLNQPDAAIGEMQIALKLTARRPHHRNQSGFDLRRCRTTRQGLAAFCQRGARRQCPGGGAARCRIL